MEVDIRYPCGYGIFYQSGLLSIESYSLTWTTREDATCPLHGKRCPPQYFGFKEVDDLLPKKRGKVV